MALTRGSASITLDPAIFGNVIAADAYSATGDQVGSANVQGLTVALEFSSVTGGIGRRPDLPLFSITAPVLTTAKPGATFSLTASPGATSWLDTQGVDYSFSVNSGTFTVGGSASISNVGVVGGVLAGVLPVGTSVEIDGNGFTAATVASIDGVPIAASSIVSPQEILLTLGGAANLDFRRVAVQNPGEAEVQFFPVLHGLPTQGRVPQAIFPLQLYGRGRPDDVLGCSLAMQNASNSDASVMLFSSFSTGGGIISTTTSQLNIGPGGSAIVPCPTVYAELDAVPNRPLRMAAISTSGSELAFPQSFVMLRGSFGWTWTVGTPAPAPQMLGVSLPENVSFNASASTQSGGQWLSVSPTEGVGCPATSGGCAPSTLSVSVNPAGLAPGIYQGSVIVAAVGVEALPAVAQVSLTVLATQTLLPIDLSPYYANYSAPSNDLETATYTLQIASNDDPTAFSVTTNVPSGEKWLSLTPASGRTPAGIAVTVDPTLLTGSSDSGTIVVHGPANSVTVPVTLSIGPPFPTPLRFGARIGQPAPPAQEFYADQSYSVGVATASGGNWLSAVLSDSSLSVSVSHSGLSAGTYEGTITLGLSQPSPYGLRPEQIPVTLVVADRIPPITASPASLSLSLAHGSTVAGPVVEISTGVFPTEILVGGSNSLSVTNSFGTTPASFTLFASAQGLAPGVYMETLNVTALADPTDSTAIPVTLTVTPGPPPLPQSGPVPLVTAVLNAASQSLASISPGEIVTIFGQNIGPPLPIGVSLAADGKVGTNASGTQVLFDGIPAPILYASASQINAVVPYEISGPAPNLVVQYGATTFPAGAYALVPSTPGIFSILNQDNSLNNAANPAAGGSAIQIYATGVGATSPSSITGEVTASETKSSVLPISLAIGGMSAPVTYAASAPGAVAGLFQVNALVPQGLAARTALPVILKVGASVSQPNVNLFVK
jgi:uncharacterized protein (TIGR03437 family)